MSVMRVAVLERLALAAMLLAFCVVVFGAYVRLTDAGLGCPDWPGCYGHATPAAAAAADAGTATAPLHVGKAWREMIHRYAASTLGFIILVIAVLALRWRRQAGIPVALPVGLLLLVMFQGLLGMLTVTLLLKPLIVTSHLLFGLATLSLLWWLWFGLRSARTGALLRPAPVSTRRLALAGLVALVLQIMLGGWTSTNYAAVACPDFPRCQGQWIPKADFSEAFVIWRGLGINYEGGVLDQPARVAIHFTHRLGAIAATLALLCASIMALAGHAEARSRRAAWFVMTALGLQLALGISMVLRGFPLALATAHNAGAALLLIATLVFYRSLGRA
jgi:heme a synthase